jgi:hypothetical protein
MLFQTYLPKSSLSKAMPFASRQTGSIPTELRGYAASALSGVIADQRQQAIADGVRAVPPNISRAVQGYFPEALLRKCRYAVGEAHKLKLPTLRLTYGDGDALTLVDVVLFHNDMVAQTDRTCWARQLTCIMQFQRWGLAEYTRRYIEQRRELEQEVATTVARFTQWSRERAL